MKQLAFVDQFPRFRKATGRSRADRSALDKRFADEARFLKSWVDSPGLTGAVSPSGRFLARAMARCVDPFSRGLVVELGPGTGPVTEALIERGVAPDRLALVEYAPQFCDLLRGRFPQTTVIQGDAYRLRTTLAPLADRSISVVVSSLPLLNRPDAERLALLEDAFDLMGPDGLFVQFTYGIAAPVPLRDGAFTADADGPVWLNLPPARVWRYRRADHYARSAEPWRRRPREFPTLLEAFGREHLGTALAKLRRLADAPEWVGQRR